MAEGPAKATSKFIYTAFDVHKVHWHASWSSHQLLQDVLTVSPLLPTPYHPSPSPPGARVDLPTSTHFLPFSGPTAWSLLWSVCVQNSQADLIIHIFNFIIKRSALHAQFLIFVHSFYICHDVIHMLLFCLRCLVNCLLSFMCGVLSLNVHVEMLIQLLLCSAKLAVVAYWSCYQY